MSTWDMYPRAKEIVADALELPYDQRAAFVDSRCGGDPDLKKEVLSLLRYAELEPGAVLQKRYRIERKLAHGGFGTTYLAKDLTLPEGNVVIKIPTDPGDADFGREVLALSKMNHPGVVRPLDVGRLSDDSPFLVMQFAPGRTLKEILGEGQMPLPRVGEIIKQCGRIVSAVHARSIYHRDLKPSNIIIDDQSGFDHVYILDFGIASVVENREQTIHTRVVGTMDYMAPEQLQGRVYATTDVYALGAIAYHLLAGKPPYSAANHVALFGMQHSPPEPPSRFRTELNDKCDELILRSLAFDPDKRPAEAKVFGEEFAEALAARPAEQKRNLVQLALALVVVLLAVGAGTVALEYQHATPRTNSTPVQKLHILRFAVVMTAADGTSERLAGTRLVMGSHRGFRMEVKSGEAGHLYLFAEGAARPRSLNVLFPSDTANQGSSYVGAQRSLQIPENTLLEFDSEKHGVERLWIIWSSRAVPALEGTRRWATPEFKNEITDAAARDAVWAHLRPSGGIQVKNGLAELTGSAEVLASVIEIVH